MPAPLERPAPIATIQAQIGYGVSSALASVGTTPKASEIWRRSGSSSIGLGQPKTSAKRFPNSDAEQLWQSTSLANLHRLAAGRLQAGDAKKWMQLRSEPAIAEALPAARKDLLLSRQACPLLSDVHLRLAEVSLVLEEAADADAPHLRRAARVLPTSPNCRYRCGWLDLSSGRVSEACSHWRRSWELSDRHEVDILAAAGSLLTTKELVERVLPRVAASPGANCPSAGLPTTHEATDAEVLLGRAEQLLREQEVAGPERFYLQASSVSLRGDTAAALDDYARAIDLNPNEISWRYEYAQGLFQQGRLDDALVQARWCTRRDPQHPDYRQLLEQIHQIKLRQP